MRRRAAVVPASKTKIGETYAVERDGKLTRFIVDRVTTHRIGDDGGPTDYKSEIGGRFVLADPVNAMVNDPKVFEKATIAPNALLGQFEEYDELVKQKEAEKEVRDAKHKAELDAGLDLWRLLYDVAGIPAPNDPSEFKQLFRFSKYGGIDITISTEGVRPLLDALRELAKEKETV